MKHPDTANIHQSKVFIDALETADVEALRTVPKTELHSHGNLAFHSYEISRVIGVEIPPPPKKFRTFKAFMKYIQTHLHPLTDTQSELEHIIYHAVEMAVDDGVVRLEMSIDCKFSNLWPSTKDFLEYLEFIVKHFKPEIDFRPELGLNRGEEMKNLIQWAIPCIESGVFKSVDLYGNEADGDLKNIKDIFKTARSYGLKLKAHSGEYGSAKDMYEIIKTLGLEEVQHGIAAAQDKSLMRFLAKNKIPLHVCPTSNVVLDRVKSMDVHPIRILADAGVIVTINSDDLAVFDQTVSQEYLNVFEAGLFSAPELDELRRNVLAHYGC